MLKQCGAQITQAYNKHSGTWGGFEISFTEYVKEISIITLSSHRRRDKKSTITRTRMLDGPLAQMAPHKVDSWSSLQTLSCCRAESQTCH